MSSQTGTPYITCGSLVAWMYVATLQPRVRLNLLDVGRTGLCTKGKTGQCTSVHSFSTWTPFFGYLVEVVLLKHG